MQYPLLQVALDFFDISRAMAAARAAVAGGADWLEAGTPLLKAAGMDAVRALRREFPDKVVVADTKTMDAGRAEVEMSAKAGAGIATVLAAASDATVTECVEAGRNLGLEVAADLIGLADPAARAEQLAALGVRHVGVHCPIDEQMKGRNPFAVLREVRRRVNIPIAVAGGITGETVVDAVEAGADIVIVGGAITKADDPEAATREIVRAMRSGKRAAGGELFRRVGDDPARLREVLTRVSTPNISDGNHRVPGLRGMRSFVPGSRFAGPVLTVRTARGDWSKPVQAIDAAEPGTVLAIDAGGEAPAVWGELATHSAVDRKLAAVVVDGCIRDTPEIRRLGFPAFARATCPDAGEAKGIGEIGGPVLLCGVRVQTGDWLVGDDDGVMHLPAARVAEMANRAQDWYEKENRIRAEIAAGRTLAQVVELYKWEKPR
jgi:3-hexulose-6-phosphate synthase/6-phospho-3-hexuloisomerase